jgi:hypothetical protein
MRSELGVAALDLVLGADPEATGARSGFDARLTALLLLSNAPVTRLTLVPELERDPTWPPEAWSVSETLDLARALRELVISASARPLRPTDVAALGQPALHREVTGDLTHRADVARDALATARSRLAGAVDANAIRSALLAADLLGVPAAPASDRDDSNADAAARQLSELQVQQVTVLSELAKRASAEVAPSLPASERLTAIFGQGFPGVPLLQAADPGGVALAASAAAAPTRGATPAAAHSWLARAALVRPSAARLDMVLTGADALDVVSSRPPVRAVDVIQLPHVIGDRWIALASATAGEPPPAGRVSLVALSPAGATSWGGDIAGFLIDEWVETVPLGHETTSIAFHYNGPTSEAPQAALLCVEAPREGWDELTVLAHVQEALALARLRAVDLDLLGAAGQLLPTLLAPVRSDDAGLGIELTEAPAI